MARLDFPYLESKQQKTLSPERRSSTLSPERRSSEDHNTVQIDVPEYDLRRAATASDPLAVVEGYKIEILLRLATILGVRMCPKCLRCNDGLFGCQDKVGYNMRPGGGILGGMAATRGATEHQGIGTPHLHAEGHIACAY